MKKLLSLMAAFVLLFGLMGCNNSTSPTPQTPRVDLFTIAGNQTVDLEDGVLYSDALSYNLTWRTPPGAPTGTAVKFRAVTGDEAGTLTAEEFTLNAETGVVTATNVFIDGTVVIEGFITPATDFTGPSVSTNRVTITFLATEKHFDYELEKFTIAASHTVRLIDGLESKALTYTLNWATPPGAPLGAAVNFRVYADNPGTLTTEEFELDQVTGVVTVADDTIDGTVIIEGFVTGTASEFIGSPYSDNLATITFVPASALVLIVEYDGTELNSPYNISLVRGTSRVFDVNTGPFDATVTVYPASLGNALSAVNPVRAVYENGELIITTYAGATSVTMPVAVTLNATAEGYGDALPFVFNVTLGDARTLTGIWAWNIDRNVNESILRGTQISWAALRSTPGADGHTHEALFRNTNPVNIRFHFSAGLGTVTSNLAGTWDAAENFFNIPGGLTNNSIVTFTANNQVIATVRITHTGFLIVNPVAAGFEMGVNDSARVVFGDSDEQIVHGRPNEFFVPQGTRVELTAQAGAGRGVAITGFNTSGIIESMPIDLRQFAVEFGPALELTGITYRGINRAIDAGTIDGAGNVSLARLITAPAAADHDFQALVGDTPTQANQIIFNFNATGIGTVTSDQTPTAGWWNPANRTFTLPFGVPNNTNVTLIVDGEPGPVIRVIQGGLVIVDVDGMDNTDAVTVSHNEFPNNAPVAGLNAFHVPLGETFTVNAVPGAGRGVTFVGSPAIPNMTAGRHDIGVTFGAGDPRRITGINYAGFTRVINAAAFVEGEVRPSPARIIPAPSSADHDYLVMVAGPATNLEFNFTGNIGVISANVAHTWYAGREALRIHEFVPNANITITRGGSELAVVRFIQTALAIVNVSGALASETVNVGFGSHGPFTVTGPYNDFHVDPNTPFTVNITGVTGDRTATISGGASVSGNLVTLNQAAINFITVAIRPPANYSRITGGMHHTVMIRGDGSLWAWGNNIAATPQRIPVRIGSDNDWVHVSSHSGAGHTVALRADGSLWSWGLGGNGRLGDGLNANRWEPTRVCLARTCPNTNCANIASCTCTFWQAETGIQFTAAIRSDGSMWTWGNNYSSQLGDNTTLASWVMNPPAGHTIHRRVGTDYNWNQVAPGGSHVLAIRNDGSLWTWGSNIFGQAGTGGTTGFAGRQSIPARLFSGRYDWVQAAGGNSQSFAISKDGTLWSWGRQDWGALGNGINTQNTMVTLPAQVGSFTDWVQVSAGFAHTIARRQDGSIWTWGFNQWGQIGNGVYTGAVSGLANIHPSADDVAFPTRLGDRTDWINVEAGEMHTIAVRQDGSIWMWGRNLNAELGDDPQHFPAPTPARVGTGNDWAYVTMGQGGLGLAHTVAIREDGTLWAWGGNTNGRLGDGTTRDRWTPVQIGQGTDWKDAQISAGWEHTMVVRADGSLWGWGVNTNGQLGNNSTANQTIPVQIGTGTNWAYVSVGHNHSVALRKDGTLWAWGNQANGRLGNNETSGNQLTPVQIGTYDDWVQISVGMDHTMAIRENGTLWGWGNPQHGRIGNNPVPIPMAAGTVATPVQIPGTWDRVWAGPSHTMARRSDGSLMGWGHGGGGRLGTGNANMAGAPTAVDVNDALDWLNVAPAGAHTLAVREGGQLWAWGDRSSGRLGDNNISGSQNSPIRIGTDSNWSMVTAGAEQSAAIRTDGSLWAWGVHWNGRLGIGAPVRAAPGLFVMP